MSDINNVLIIGTNEYAGKIENLFSKAGMKTECIAAGAKETTVPDLVIEAIDGDANARKAALINAQRAKETILATTIQGGVTAVAAGTDVKGKVVGLNFVFNPDGEKCLVQIVKGLDTEPELLAICQQIAEKIGVTSIIVEDVAGLAVDRVMASTINEAAYMLETNLATMEDINNVPKACLNWPLGPFEFADYIGIDKVVATLDAAAEYSQQYVPCRVLRQMVTAGRLGRKTGRGFYDYSNKE